MGNSNEYDITLTHIPIDSSQSVADHVPPHPLVSTRPPVANRYFEQNNSSRQTETVHYQHCLTHLFPRTRKLRRTPTCKRKRVYRNLETE